MVEIAATLFVIIVGLYIGAWVLFGVFALIGAVLNEPPLPPEPFRWPWQLTSGEKEFLLYVGGGYGMLLFLALLESLGLIR
jgi:hypothetical protein